MDSNATVPSFPPIAPPPPPASPNPWQRFTAWFGRLGTAAKAAFIASTAAVFLCACCGGLAAVGSSISTTVVSHAAAATATHPGARATGAVLATVTPKAAVTATPKPRPTATKPPPTQVPPPRATNTPAPRYPAINNNPYDLNFVCCHLVYNPPADICNWLNCIASFWTSTNGYVDECVDGTFSHSGGRTGACSHHGGEKQPVYQP